MAWRRDAVVAVEPGDQLRLLRTLGLRDREVARGIPAARGRMVRRWRRHGTDGMFAAQRTAIEELCAIAGYLLADGTYDEQGVAAWLCSPHAVLNGACPLDAVRQARFVDVLTAAEDTRSPGWCAAGRRED